MNAQLKVDSIGRIRTGVPYSLDNDGDGVLSMQIFGKNTSTYSSGGKLAFGDFGRKSLNGCNVFVGEYGTTDTDRLWLHGKRGLYLTYGNSDPVIAYFDPQTGDDCSFNFNYNVRINGNLVLTSDERLKENIHPLQGSLGSLKRLRGVNYHLKNPARKNKSSHLRSDSSLAEEDVENLTEKERQDKEFFDNLEKELAEKSQLTNGFLAQELQQVFPDLVHEDKDGLLSVDYIGLIPIIVESIKEQQQLIDAQSKKIKELEQKNTNSGKSSNLRTDTDESDSSGTTDMDDVNPTLSNA
ncbi:hypothetical protein FACS1894176_04080 [Bacteroidia bacterium]|nr:hypothetical protein FACS1894176_04080 [Bacteroidia bacterium]